MACIGGVQGVCNTRNGPWSHRRVTCAQRLTLSVLAPFPPTAPSPPPPPPDLPAPPPATNGLNLSGVQQAVLQRAAERGQNPEVVAAETAQLMALLDARATREWLAHFDASAGLHLLRASELYERLREELESAEVVHNFDVQGWGGTNQGYNNKPYCGQDTTVESGPQMEWFYNLYELWKHNIIQAPDYRLTNDIEEDMLGFPGFSSFPPSDDEAADRIVWGALNLYRKSTGNPTCGPVSAIFAKKLIGPNALVSPVDSGIVWQFRGDIMGGNYNPYWQFILNDTIARNWYEPTQPSLSTSAGSTAHLIPTYVHAFTGSRFIAGDNSASYNLARMLLRLLSRGTYRTPFAQEETSSVPVELNFLEVRYGYVRCERIDPSSIFQSAPVASR